MAKKKRKAAGKTAKKPPTKSQIYSEIATKTELARRDVTAVFDELSKVIKKSLRSNGQATVPNMCKLVVKKKPATKARKGINPFTGEEMMFKAKPASKTVRARPLKGVKDMV